MGSRPDFNIMSTEKTASGTFYKKVGVAWKGTTKDGREKINLSLFMFPGLDLNCFLNDDDEVKSPRSSPPTRPSPQPISDEDIPF